MSLGCVAYLGNLSHVQAQEAMQLISSCDKARPVFDFSERPNVMFAPAFEDTRYDTLTTYLRTLLRSKSIQAALRARLPILKLSSLDYLISSHDFYLDRILASTNQDIFVFPLQGKAVLTDERLFELLGAKIVQEINADTALIVTKELPLGNLYDIIDSKGIPFLSSTLYERFVKSNGSSIPTHVREQYSLRQQFYLPFPETYFNMNQLLQTILPSKPLSLQPLRVFCQREVPAPVLQLVRSSMTEVASLSDAEYVLFWERRAPALHSDQSAVTPFWVLASLALQHPVSSRLIPCFHSYPKQLSPYELAVPIGIGNRPLLRLIVASTLTALGMSISFNLSRKSETKPDVIVCCCPPHKLIGRRQRFVRRASTMNIPIITLDFFFQLYFDRVSKPTSEHICLPQEDSSSVHSQPCQASPILKLTPEIPYETIDLH